MPKFEAVRKIEQPAIAPEATLTATGWIRIGDAEFKKDKQGRWRERTADANAPGSYINKDRIAQLNLEKTAENVGAKFEVTPKPIKELTPLTPEQEKRLRKKAIKTEILPKKPIMPPPLPKEKKIEISAEELPVEKEIEEKPAAPTELVDVKGLVEGIKKGAEQEMKREALRPNERALAEVKAMTAEDIAAEEREADVQIAMRKIQEQKAAKAAKEADEIDFYKVLTKMPTQEQKKTAADRERKRAEAAKLAEQKLATKIFRDFPKLLAKKEELERLLAKKEREANLYYDKQFMHASEMLNAAVAGQDIDGTNLAADMALSRMAAMKIKETPQIIELREIIQSIKERLQTFEEEAESLTSTSKRAGERIAVDSVTTRKKSQKKDEQAATIKAEALTQEETKEYWERPETVEEFKVFEDFDKMPNVAKKDVLKANESSRIMHKTMREAEAIQRQIDEKHKSLGQLKAELGVFGSFKALFSKDARAKVEAVKNLESEIFYLHDQMEQLTGERNMEELTTDENKQEKKQQAA